MSTPANALDITQAGLVKFDGSTTFTGVTVTLHDVLVGAASNGITSVSPSTAGFVLTSNGVAADPSFQAPAVPAKAIVVAYLNTGLTNVTGDSTGLVLIYDTITTNIGGAYDNTTGVFTAPRAGNYLFSATVMFNNLLGTHSEGELKFNPVVGGIRNILIFNPGLNATSIVGYTQINSQCLTGIVQLLAAQAIRVSVNVYNGTKTVGIQGATFAQETSLSIVEL